MRLSWLLSLPTLLTAVSAIAIQKRDADFLSVRTKQHKDMSGKGGDPKTKYFHESVFHPHYDGRFADKQLGYRERRLALSNLIQTYLSTFSDIGVETWLMHGTLLGWWWNRKILPWDSDSDVQVSEASIHYLASYYNMSVFHYKTPRIPEGRDYMLEINPHYVNREQNDEMNVIDARWVDTTSGLFIDITTARYNYTHPAGQGMLSCKDGHEYRDSYIFPLRDTFFEGARAKIPYAYKELLEAEYKEQALTLTEFEGHHFDDQKMEWIPIPKKADSRKKEEKKPESKEEPKKEKPKEEPKKEEKKVEDKKTEQPIQPQQGQQAQNQQPQQQNNQQTQQTNSQKPTANSDTKPQGGQPPGQQSPPPPVAKDSAKQKPSEPQKPAIQQKAEEKQAAAEQTKNEKLEVVEADRRAKELKAALKAQERAKEDAKLSKQEVKKEDTSKQTSSPPPAEKPKVDPKVTEEGKKKAEEAKKKVEEAEKKKLQNSEVRSTEEKDI